MYAVNYSNDDSYSVLIFARAAVKPKYSHAIAGEFMGVFTYQSSNSSLDSCAQSITESVDSVCRDTTYTQYMLIQKNLSKSQKRYTYKAL